MREVYVLLGGWDYEGSEPLAAFEDESEAEEMRGQCERHRLGRPNGSAEMQEWRKAHPMGDEGYGHDFYEIRAIALNPASSPPPSVRASSKSAAKP